MVDHQHILLDPSDLKDTRSGFGQGLLEAGKGNEKVVGLCADLTGSLKMNALSLMIYISQWNRRFCHCISLSFLAPM